MKLKKIAVAGALLVLAAALMYPQAKLAWYMLRRLVDMLLNPKRTIESIIGKLRSR